jgi:hypothetical protein
MASLADISKLLDDKLTAAWKEIVDDLQSTFFHKIEADIAALKEQEAASQTAITDLKEQAAANQVAVARVKSAERRIPLRQSRALTESSSSTPEEASGNQNSTSWNSPPLMARKMHSITKK